MFGEMLENVKKRRPLIHNITNYVTVNDCANALLACGGSPIMSDEAEEAEDITAICGGLTINIGTLSRRTIPAMFAAGAKAASLSHPIVLDPVGAGASALRTGTALALLEKIPFTAIRGNISEIKALAAGTGTTRGVDADDADRVTEDTLERSAAFVKAFAARTGAVVAVTGAIDIVADGETAWAVRNGHPMMSAVTGAGCQLSCVTAAYLAANPDAPLRAAAAAVCAMGVCGEIAWERMDRRDGNASYRNYIIDALWNLDGGTLDRRANYKIL